MKRLEHSRSGEKHSTTSCVSPYTSFVLEPFPAYFTTEQRTVEALFILFVNQTKIYYKLHYSGVYSDSLDVRTSDRNRRSSKDKRIHSNFWLHVLR